MTAFKTMTDRIFFREKSRKTFARSPEEVAQKLIPKVMHKIPPFEQRALWGFPLGCWVFFFILISLNSEL